LEKRCEYWVHAFDPMREWSDFAPSFETPEASSDKPALFLDATEAPASGGGD